MKLRCTQAMMPPTTRHTCLSLMLFTWMIIPIKSATKALCIIITQWFVGRSYCWFTIAGTSCERNYCTWSSAQNSLSQQEPTNQPLVEITFPNWYSITNIRCFVFLFSIIHHTRCELPGLHRVGLCGWRQCRCHCSLETTNFDVEIWRWVAKVGKMSWNDFRSLWPLWP